MPDPRQTEALNATLRGAAARFTSLVEGSCCLIFSTLPGEEGGDGPGTLRAAAGFQSPDTAREAANILSELVESVTESGQPAQQAGHADLPGRASADLRIAALRGIDRIHGAVVLGATTTPSQTALEQLDQLIDSLSIQLDYAHLREEVPELRKLALESESSADGKNDELLKLSEQLFAQDIELLRNNEKLGKIEKLKNDFIEKMSRELRTPLNSIIEAVISVLTGENEALSESSKENLRHALDEGTAFQRTLENILDLWRIKQNELPIEIQEVSFAELVDEAIFSVQDTLAGKPVEIIKELDPLIPKFRADLAKVNQILFLSLDNAAKFTLDGEIHIRARITEGSELFCEIEDSGIGICSDDQQFIFDDFYQVDDRASARYRGAGLGLTLVRDLLVLLDGEVSIESDAGKGTRISFQIPVQLN